jgi:hypothetical protein
MKNKIINVNRSNLQKINNMNSNNTNLIFIVINEKNQMKLKWHPQYALIESNINAKFESNLKNMKSEFISELDKISSKRGIRWQATRTAEQNTIINDLFRNVILCRTVQDEIVKDKQNIILTDVDEVIYFFSKRNSIKLKLYFMLRTFKNIIRIIYSMINFVYFFCTCKITSYFLPDVKTDVVIHTFIDQTKNLNAQYKEIYFPKIKAYYETNNISVSHLIGNTGRFPYKRFRILNSQGYKIFNEYRNYNVFDLFGALINYFVLYMVKTSKFTIQGENMSRIFNFSHKKEGMDFGVLNALLRYKLLIKIEKKSNEPRLLLLEHEGMIFEKMITAGLRKTKLKTKIFGYQHMPIFENMLCNFYSKYQVEQNLMPDKIICSGKFYYGLYLKNGTPLEKLEVGPALRYQYLLNTRNTVLPFANKILVNLPLDLHDCLFLIRMIKRCGLDRTYSIGFKLHPKFDSGLILNELKSIVCSLETEPLVELFDRYQVVVSMNSGSLLDAALLGKLVIKINRKFRVDLDPLFANKELRFEISSDDELIHIINNFVLFGYRDKLAPSDLKLLYFNYTSSTSLEVFLP